MFSTRSDSRPTAEAKSALKEEIEGIDLVLMSSLDEISLERKTLSPGFYAAKTGMFLETAGRLRLSFDDGKNPVKMVFENVLLAKDKFGEAPEIKSLVSALRAETNAKLKNILTEAETNIAIRNDSPSPLGALIAGCAQDWAKTDFTLINSDSVRTNIRKGKVAEYLLYEMYPYNDTVMSVKIRGEEIKDVLEKALSAPGSFPQTRGLEVVYSPLAPYGEKIKSVRVNGRPIRAEAVYKMATTDHMVATGFSSDETPNLMEFKNTQTDLRAVLRGCLRKKKTLSAPEPDNWSIAE
jgi:2',3'-cyclic-nucleotide 2'-phosphodiesterase (5'-nucleotidase family)